MIPGLRRKEYKLDAACGPPVIGLAHTAHDL